MTTQQMLRYVNMLTVDEFQTASSEFKTSSRQDAIDEAKKYNLRGVRGHTIFAAKIGDQWCVMLDSAALTMSAIGVVEQLA